ncbi:hypothetical protein ABZW49_46030 [Nonomuraea wenchangensis]
MSAPTTGLGAAEPEEVGLSSMGLDRVDAAVRRKIDEGVIAGAVTLVARHGEIVRLRAMGLDRRFPRRPMRTSPPAPTIAATCSWPTPSTRRPCGN